MRTKPLVVNVTQEDIDKGEAASCSSCPIALALRRIAPLARVYTDCVALAGELYSPKAILESHTFIRLPEEAMKFIQTFDFRNHVSPFSFTLQVPE